MTRSPWDSVGSEYSFDRREQTEMMKIDDLHEFLDIGTLGWEKPGQSPLTEILAKLQKLSLSLNYWYGNAPKILKQLADSRLGSAAR